MADIISKEARIGNKKLCEGGYRHRQAQLDDATQWFCVALSRALVKRVYSLLLPQDLRPGLPCFALRAFRIIQPPRDCGGGINRDGAIPRILSGAIFIGPLRGRDYWLPVFTGMTRDDGYRPVSRA